MREIKFRGKSVMEIGEMDRFGLKHNNGWVYGNLVMCGNQPYIVGDFIEVDEEFTINEWWCPVYADSLGQFTGLKVKNGKGIYEGDIVEVTHEDKFKTIGQVVWGLDSHRYGNYPAFTIPEFDSDLNSFAEIFDSGNYDIEVIGNIYEHKYLLEAE